MYIHEAVKKAVEENCYITRKSVDNAKSYHTTRIKPTNSYAACMIYTFNAKGEEVHHCKNWNPTAEDLIANDWELIN